MDGIFLGSITCFLAYFLINIANFEFLVSVMMCKSQKSSINPIFMGARVPFTRVGSKFTTSEFKQNLKNPEFFMKSTKRTKNR